MCREWRERSPRRRFQRKPLVSDPGMHHGTCVTHVPWCMSGSLTCGDGENVPGIPGACAPAILRIWQEAHGAAYTRQWTELALVQVKICRLFGSKPLPKPMLAYCLSDSWEPNSVKFKSEFYDFHSRKLIWYVVSQNGGHFVQGEIR